MALVLDRNQVEPAKQAAVNPSGSNGQSSPIGATILPGGANFSLFSRAASGVELLLFDREEDSRPARVIRFDPAANLTYHYWHVFVRGVQPGQLYGYRVQGPSDPSSGLRFDSSKVLLDPYGRAIVVPRNYSRLAASREAEEARRRAEARLREKLSDEEVATVNASLARSLAQLRVKRRQRR